jgi:hypothetical protein
VTCEHGTCTFTLRTTGIQTVSATFHAEHHPASRWPTRNLGGGEFRINVPQEHRTASLRIAFGWATGYADKTSINRIIPS